MIYFIKKNLVFFELKNKTQDEFNMSAYYIIKLIVWVVDLIVDVLVVIWPDSSNQ